MLHVAIAQSREVRTSTAIDSLLAQCEAQLGGWTPQAGSTPGRINISQATYERVREHFACEPRGKVAVKNVGEIDMHFVLNPLSPA